MTAAGQLLRVEIDATPPPRGELLRVELTTPAVALARGEVLRVELSVPLTTSVDLGADRVVESLELITIGATWSGGTPLSWAWQVVSDTSGMVVLSPDGDQVALWTPAVLTGAVVVIGVTADNGQTVSPLASVKITVYPHLDMLLTEGGWVPRGDEIIIGA